MPLTLHRSNRIEALGDALAKLLDAQPLADPFAAESILVSSTGLRDWLKWRLAHHHGIAAHLHVVFPGHLTAWLHAAHHPRPTPTDEDASPWVPDRLVWIVATELLAWRTSPPSTPAADRLARYLDHIRTPADLPHTLSAPLFALATQITSLFQRYHNWRPHMIAAWANGRDLLPTRRGALAPFTGPLADLAWQPELWRRVRQRLATTPHDPVAALGQLHPQPTLGPHTLQPDPPLAAALAHTLPPRLTLFGVHGLNPLQLLALHRIAQTIPVHWFLPAPTPFWLGDQSRAQLWVDDAERRAARQQYLVPPQAPDVLPTSLHDSPDAPAPPDFDDLQGNVCPLVAAFGRVPRASQLLVETLLPNAADGDVEFQHPIAAAHPEHPSDRLPSLLHRLQADVYMLESAAYAGHDAGTPFRSDIDSGAPIVSRRGDRSVDPHDHSLAFHACYGPSRQVDATRDLIVHALASDTTLRPGDIAVMTPDIATFAPQIEATFLPHAPRTESRQRTGIPGIPIRIQDRSIRSTNPVAGVLLALLGLADGRRTVTDVIALLGLEPVHTHFGLQRDDITRIEKWLRMAGARWGIDPDDVLAEAGTGPAQGRPDSRLRHTLAAAVERLALGCVMPLEAAHPAGGAPRIAAVRREAPASPVFPLDEAGERDLATRAILFLETLLGCLDELREARPLGDWISLFARTDDASPGLLQRFVTLPASRAWQKAQVIDELDALARDEDTVGLTGRIDGAPTLVSAAAVAAWMTQRMDKADRRVADGLDAVTFCSLMPVRSVPYRLVVLLGVDAEIFPRQGTRPAWDLIAREPQPWDRNPRDEDRALFLDALLSARDACHIVFTGRTPQRNEAVAPAAPVAELMEMLDRRFDPPAPADGEPAESASRYLTRHYPLQPFSERNFLRSADEEAGRVAPRPVVHHQGEYHAACNLLEGRGQREPWTMNVPWTMPPRLPERLAQERSLSLSLNDLARFFADPLTHWLREVGGLRWPDQEAHDTDDLLPVGMDTLAQMKVMSVLDAKGVPWADELAGLFTGLPVGAVGVSEGRRLARQVDLLHHEHARRFRKLSRYPVQVALVLEHVPGAVAPLHVRLHGEVAVADWTPEYPGFAPALIHHQFSTLREKHAVPAWLHLLATTAAQLAPGGRAPAGIVAGVANYREKDNVSFHALPLSRLGCPDAPDEAAAWASAELEHAVRTWLAGLARPMPVLPTAGADMVGAARKAWRKSAEVPPSLADWLALCRASAVEAGLESPAPWQAAAERLADELGPAGRAAALRCLLDTLNPEEFFRGEVRFREDTEQPLLRQLFGETGPAARWPDACLVESFRVLGPGVALAEAMGMNMDQDDALHEHWQRGGRR